MNLGPCQKQLECLQHVLKKIRFVKIIFKWTSSDVGDGQVTT